MSCVLRVGAWIRSRSGPFTANGRSRGTQATGLRRPGLSFRGSRPFLAATWRRSVPFGRGGVSRNATVKGSITIAYSSQTPGRNDALATRSRVRLAGLSCVLKSRWYRDKNFLDPFALWCTNMSGPLDWKTTTPGSQQAVE
jgi:hypothetical protein